MSLKNLTKVGLLVGVMATLAACAPSKSSSSSSDASVTTWNTVPHSVSQEALNFSAEVSGAFANQGGNQQVSFKDGIYTLSKQTTLELSTGKASCSFTMSFQIYHVTDPDYSWTNEFKTAPKRVLSVALIGVESAVGTLDTSSEPAECVDMINKTSAKWAAEPTQYMEVGYTKVSKNQIKIFSKADKHGNPAQTTNYYRMGASKLASSGR